MAKYIQPNFIVDSSASFLKNTTFNGLAAFDSSIRFGGVTYSSFGTMAVESSANYYNSSQVDELIIDISTSIQSVDSSITALKLKDTQIDASIARIDASLNDVVDITTILDASFNEIYIINSAQDASITALKLKDTQIDATIARIDASLNDVVDITVILDASFNELYATNAAQDASITALKLKDTQIDASIVRIDGNLASIEASIARIDVSLNDTIEISEIIDASLAVKVDKAGDTMTGQLVFASTGFSLDGTVINTIDTSAGGLSDSSSAIATSGLIKSYVDTQISQGVTASNGLTEVDGDIQLGGFLTKFTEIDITNNNFGLYGEKNWTGIFIEDTDDHGHVELYTGDVGLSLATSDGILMSATNVGLLLASSDGIFMSATNSMLEMKTIDQGGDILLTSGNNKGIQYAADYSASFTDRSLVDKAYVDNATSSVSVSAWNGLTRSVDGSIGLGGTVVQDVRLISGTGAENFYLGNDSETGVFRNVEIVTRDMIRMRTFDYTDDTKYSGLSIRKTDAIIYSDDPSGYASGTFGTNGILLAYYDLFTDNTFSLKIGKNAVGNNAVVVNSDANTFDGIVYDQDYSANFTDRSLVDKAYVDSQILGGAITDGEGTTANGTSVDLGGTLTADANIQTGLNTLFVTGILNVVGDLIVDGSTTHVNSVNLDVSDNIITVNSGETGSGVSKGYAGLLVDRGTSDPYVFVFEESSDTFRIGIGTESGLPVGTQAVATRQDTPISTGIAYWNNSTNRFDTVSGFTYDASGLGLSTVVASTTESTALFFDGVHVVSRELGTNAFTSTAYATDASISALTNRLNTTDASVALLQTKDTQIDASIVRIDASIASLVTKGASVYKGTFDGTAGTTITITAATHGLGVGPLSISVYDGIEQVYTDVECAANGDMTLTWGSGTLTASCKYVIIG